ncbi:mCG147355 [Mus musculus]|nr:mCG147355 [Mus musculus]
MAGHAHRGLRSTRTLLRNSEGQGSGHLRDTLASQGPSLRSGFAAGTCICASALSPATVLQLLTSKREDSASLFPASSLRCNHHTAYGSGKTAVLLVRGGVCRF